MQKDEYCTIYQKAFDLYRNGRNISKYFQENEQLQEQHKLDNSDIIAMSYDLQAGTYTRNFYRDGTKPTLFSQYIIQLLDSLNILQLLSACANSLTFCDFGTGESTNYIPFLNELKKVLQAEIIPFGMDISLSRLDVAKCFGRIESLCKTPNYFLGDLSDIPLADKTIDISLTMHSIEPNKGREHQIVKELARVTKGYLVCAEPIYETASTEQRERMDYYGYIQGLRTALFAEDTLSILGEFIVPLELCDNPINRTTIIIAKKVDQQAYNTSNTDSILACPLGKIPLYERSGYWISPHGLCYPQIKDIPVLLRKVALPYFQDIKQLN